MWSSDVYSVYTHTHLNIQVAHCTVFILEVKFMNETETECYDRSSQICDVSREVS